MKDKNTYRRYADFIEDEDFVKWRLTGDEYLEAEWHKYIEANPDLRPIYEEAINYFDRFGIHKELLPKPDRTQLYERIQDTYISIKRKKKIRLLRNYVSAACFVLLIGLTFYYTQIRPLNIGTDEIAAIIEGVELNGENIRLVTSSGTTSFEKDIYVQIDKDNTISIQQSDEGERTEIKTGLAETNKLIVPFGKRSQIRLVDGTKIWLNSGSVLEFPSTFTGKTRDIYLTGEMYADVAKDNNVPFHVHTANFDVKVYGTRFNVSAYENTQQAIVLEHGRVGVKTLATKDEVMLAPNDMAILSNNTFTKKEVDASLFTSWKDGYLIFDNTSVLYVLNQVARYYNLSFNYENINIIEKRKCTGKIYLSDNLDNVLTTISLLSSTKYKRDGQKISISIEP